ncbi:WG repeat-containing protein [Mucilaginibacter sp.]|uniref:WG repeat-containing protein n=1 Tax=Mucilaginibacter sp. TaxID=1882438 RepID=UPI003AFFF7EA
MKNSVLTLFFFLIASSIYSQNSKEKIDKNRFLERKNNKYGMVDSLNNIITPFKYDFIEFKNNRLIVRHKNLNGLFSLDNKELIPVQYEFLLPRDHDRFILFKKASLNGLSDSDGNLILPVKYKYISSVENDNFYIIENDKKLNGVYDFKGRNVIPEEYKFYTVDNNKIFAEKNNQPMIFDLKKFNNTKYLEKDITFIETVRHYSWGEQLFQIVKKQHKYGVINSQNETVIPIIYDEIRSSENWKYFIIKQNNKIGLININGNIIRKAVYDNFELRKEYIVLKRKGKKDEYYSYQD